jgi:hypothetical protein
MPTERVSLGHSEGTIAQTKENETEKAKEQAQANEGHKADGQCAGKTIVLGRTRSQLPVGLCWSRRQPIGLDTVCSSIPSAEFQTAACTAEHGECQIFPEFPLTACV